MDRGAYRMPAVCSDRHCEILVCSLASGLVTYPPTSGSGEKNCAGIERQTVGLASQEAFQVMHK